MATGTGKTLTGLYGVTKLWDKLQKMVTVIVCPYQHLVEQWVEDVKKFNMNPVICYSKYKALYNSKTMNLLLYDLFYLFLKKEYLV